MKKFKLTIFKLIFLSLCLTLILIDNNALSQCMFTTNGNIKTYVGYGAEGWVYINPSASNEAITSEIDKINHYLKLYKTTNSGINWTQDTLTSSGPNGADPAVIIDTSGNYYVAYFATIISILKSTNHGTNWGLPYTLFNGTADKEFLWIDNSNSSQYKGNLYCAFTEWSSKGIKFSYSSDQGNTWPTSTLFENGKLQYGAVIQTDNNGYLYAAWDETNGLQTWQNIYFSYSTNGGANWSSPSSLDSTVFGEAHRDFTGVGLSMTVDMQTNEIYLFWSSKLPGNDRYSVNYMKGNYNNILSNEIKTIFPYNSTMYNYTYPWVSCDPITGKIACIYYKVNGDPYDCNQDNGCNVGAGISVSCNSGLYWSTIYQDDPIYQTRTQHDGTDYIGINFYNNLVIGIWCEGFPPNDTVYSSSFNAITTPLSVPFIISGGKTVIIPDSTHIVFNVPGTYMKIDTEGVNGATDTILLGHGSTIEFYNGTYLSARNCVFKSLDSGSLWNSIILNNTPGDTIINCSFTNAITALSISAADSTAMNKHFIKGNTFNVKTDSTSNPVYAIYLSGVQNATIDSNTFNMQNAGTNTALWIENHNIAGSQPNLNIVKNNFTSGGTQIVLNGLGSDLIPFYIAGNNFSGTEGNSCIGLWARKATGTFKNNTFGNGYYNAAVQIYQSTMNIFNNQPMLTDGGTGIYVGESSTAQIAPVVDGNG